MIKFFIILLICMIGSYLGVEYFKGSSLASFWCGALTLFLGNIVQKVKI